MTISASFARSLRLWLSCPALAASCAALVGSGCSGDDLPSSKLGNTTDVNLEPDAPRVPVTNDGTIDPFLEGNWVGQAEDLFHSSVIAGQRPTYTFPSGSSDIYLQISFDSDQRSGTLRFGSRDAPEPEAGIPYGAGLKYYAAPTEIFAPVEGASYPLWQDVLNGGGSYSAIALDYAQDSAFHDWCPVQPSIPSGYGAFNCVGAAGSSGGDPEAGIPCDITLADDSHQNVDCNLLTLCQSVCDCGEAGCFMNTSGPVNKLWLAREGDQIIGEFAGGVFDYGEAGHAMPIGTVRFTRDNP
jgi:hypothetical protein